MANCHICRDNQQQDAGTMPWGIARLQTGYVRLNPNQYFIGSCFLCAKACVHELHELAPEVRSLHLSEMAEVAAAVYRAFEPRKFNYEALGNGAPHLHWWLTPRYSSDPRPIGPIWEDLEFLRAQWTDGARPSEDERLDRVCRILEELRAGDLLIEQSSL